MNEFNCQKTKDLILQLKVCIINVSVLIDMFKDEPEGFIAKGLVLFKAILSLHLQATQASIPEEHKYQFKYGNLLD